MELKPGVELLNGAVLIDITPDEHQPPSVLALWPSPVTPWVIWRIINPDTGNCHDGTYFHDFQNAMTCWSTYK